MGFFSFLKTSEKALNTATELVKSGVNGIDALFFTKEEKSKASMEMINMWIRTQEVLRDENTAKSITRRYLAVSIIAFTFILGLFAVAVHPWFPEWSDYALKLLREYGFMTTSVIVFYFGYYAVKQIVGSK